MNYKYMRMKAAIGGVYYCDIEDRKLSPRQVINEMAALGYRYAGNVPVKLGAYGALIEYDMIFEA
ncbi:MULTISPECIES: hypothetical protein [Ruminococcus]|uniref:DUF4177 domain-containing protein n=1 Tax=Ruminococcus flavefaciens TaxID=1265 RepID=A0A1M7KCA3_RUMFL|nr:MULTISPECIES: hypothetical protein [Ruminococcus]MCR4795535.1 hypothetical protein [Ruminococcus sp.]SHM62812.1 hypothetical protein SAMN04487860_10836 [Ruminococcus flavefaciens]